MRAEYLDRSGPMRVLHSTPLSCRRENKCRVCQQTFLESPSLGLDRLLSLVSLPCKHGERGCPETVAVPGKAEHETNCPYR